MQDKLKTFRGRLIVAAAFLTVFFITGCQQADLTRQSALVSLSGIRAESLLPENTMIVLKIGTKDQAQLDGLAQLMGNFPSDAGGSLKKEIMDGLDKGLAESGLNFETDIKLVIGSNPEAMFAFGESPDSQDHPDMTFLLPVADKTAAASVLDKMVQKGFQKQSYKSAVIYTEVGKDSYYALYGDMMIFSNKLEVIQKGIEGADSNQGTFLQNANYQKGLAKAGNSLGFFFMDTGKLSGALSKTATTEQAGTQMDNALIKGVEGEIFSVSAEKEGLRLKAYVFGDEKQMQDSYFAKLPLGQSYLYKSLDGENIILYSEGYNMRKLVEMEAEAYKNLEGFDKLGSGVNSGLKNLGIDPEKDLLSFLDKGFAVVFRDGGSIVPAIEFYVDAGSNPAGAKKVLGKIYDVIGRMLDQAADPAVKNIISNEQAQDGSYLLKIDLNKAEKGQIDPALEQMVPGKTIEFRYGLDSQNMLSLVLNPLTAGGKPLSENEEFKTVLAFVNGYDESMTYIAVAPLMNYVDRFVEFAKSSGSNSAAGGTSAAANGANTTANGTSGGSNATANGFADYDTFKQFITPVKSFIFATKKPSGGEIEMQGFVHIGK